MMMTAAGTIKAARVLVMGAGVAGLQAIATARRLGAIVSATDVRIAAKEQVESLGATFITVDEAAMRAAETAGGYAREMGEDFARRQREMIAQTLRRTDIVICTALIPGRRAPVLLTADMVAGHDAGFGHRRSRGRGRRQCRGQPARRDRDDGERRQDHRPPNMPSRIAVDASQLYARNLLAFLALLVDKERQLHIDTSDEIIKAALLTADGAVVNPQPSCTQPTAGAGTRPLPRRPSADGRTRFTEKPWPIPHRLRRAPANSPVDAGRSRAISTRCREQLALATAAGRAGRHAVRLSS